MSTINIKFISIKIDFGFIAFSNCSNSSTYTTSNPRSTCNSIVCYCNCSFFFNKFVYVILQYFIFYICSVFCCITEDRSIEGIFSLSFRFRFNSYIGFQTTLTSFFAECDIANIFNYSTSSQALCNFYVARQIAFTFNHTTIFFISTIDVRSVVQFVCQAIQYRVYLFCITSLNTSIIGS